MPSKTSGARSGSIYVEGRCGRYIFGGIEIVPGLGWLGLLVAFVKVVSETVPVITQCSIEVLPGSRRKVQGNILLTRDL